MMNFCIVNKEDNTNKLSLAYSYKNALFSHEVLQISYLTFTKT